MSFCFSSEEIKRQWEEKKTNQVQATCKVSQCARLLLHLCWRSVKTDIFFTLCGILLTLAQHTGPLLALREAWRRRVCRFGPSTSGGSAARPLRGCWRGSARMAASWWGTATRCRASTACVWGERRIRIIVLPEHLACIVRDELLTWRRLSPCLQQQINQLQLLYFCFFAVKIVSAFVKTDISFSFIINQWDKNVRFSINVSSKFVNFMTWRFSRKTPFVHTYRLAHSADGWCLQVSERQTASRSNTRRRMHVHTHTRTLSLSRSSRDELRCDSMFPRLCDQQDSGVRLQAFRTVAALIEHYRRGSASGVTLPPLTQPLDRTQIQGLNHGQGRTRAQR